MSALGAVASRLRLLIPRLGSPYDGELVATVLQIRRTLQGAGLDLHDLAENIDKAPRPPESWRVLVDHCLQAPACLTNRERTFLESMRRWRGNPTPKQGKWLLEIHRGIFGDDT